MKVQVVPFIPGSTTPARVFHNSGLIQINKSRWDEIHDDFHKKFILNHEVGHYLGKTNNELYADTYAFNALAGTEPYSLRRSITALSTNLPKNSPQYNIRVAAAEIRALKYDAIHNKNKKAFDMLKKKYPETVSNYSSYDNLIESPRLCSYSHWVIIGTVAIIIVIILFLTIKKNV